MDHSQVIERRRMVRNFREEPIDEAAVERIVAAGLQGPSAGFSQGFAYLALESPEDRERFWATNEHNPQPERVRTAPLVVFPLASKEVYLDRYAEPDKGLTDRDEARWPVPYRYIDTGMGALNILHAAVAEGVGALFFGITPRTSRSRARPIPADGRTSKKSSTAVTGATRSAEEAFIPPAHDPGCWRNPRVLLAGSDRKWWLRSRWRQPLGRIEPLSFNSSLESCSAHRAPFPPTLGLAP